MAMVKTVFCFAYAAIAAVLLLPIGALVFLLGLIGLRRPMSKIGYRVAQGWARSLLGLIGCRVTALGRENVPRSGGVCFVANHDSIADILVMLAFAGRPVGFVAKKELIAVPIFNVWIAVLGGLFIDRKNPRKALGTITEGAARIGAGGGMIVFPEGSRSKGRGLMPFRPGALKLATLSRATIVPVALSGTYDVFERKRRAQACRVRVAFLEPIGTADVQGGGRRTELSDRVREAIRASLDEGGA